MTLSDCRQLSLLWLSLLDERRKFLDFIRLPTMALYWSLGILFTSSTLLSQLFFVFANKYDVATVCFYVCPKFSLSLQTNMMLLQSVFMFVPIFLYFCKKNMLICNLFLCLSQASFVLQKKYVVSAISSYVCPKVPLFLQKKSCFCNFLLLCMSQVFEKTYYVDVICFISILHWQIFQYQYATVTFELRKQPLKFQIRHQKNVSSPFGGKMSQGYFFPFRPTVTKNKKKKKKQRPPPRTPLPPNTQVLEIVTFERWVLFIRSYIWLVQLTSSILFFRI